MTNIGIVGLGFMGLTHIKAYRQLPNANIVAICDAIRLPADGNLTPVAGNISTADQIKFDMSVVKGYRDYAEMLANPDVQLVDICLPTPLHAPVAIAALRAGKHVICEKPLARTSAVCREILEAAKSAKGYFMPAHCLRFWPEWAWAKQAITEGRYGKVLAARFRRVSEPPGWSKGTYLKGEDSGGALLDLHIHDTDFVQFCFGRPRRVYSQGFSRLSGAIDHVVTQYDVPGGAAVSAEGTWVMHAGHGFNMAYTIVFENATADYDLTRGAAPLKLFQDGQPPQTIACAGGDGYLGELRHMLESIEAGRPPSMVTGEDGLNAVAICEAEERSIKSGQLVVL
jgi:predicted dehydrogenase